MKNYNLIWIVVDSVRSYKTGIDDRDRLDVMDTFAKHCIEFKNAFASAPSSALSASTMFTGLPACLISRHFNDWDFDEKKTVSVQKILRDYGYPLYTIFDSREGRSMMRKMIHPLSAKFFPRGISHNNWWTNKEVTDILGNILKIDCQHRPAFYLLWYDCRRDPNTSDEVARALDLFKKNGFFEDSIILLCSDHGYPDPTTGLTEEAMKKFTHDMIITDDNVKVPLLMRYPNCEEGLVIDEVIGLIDLFPTICEILDIPAQNKQFKYKGKSLMDIIEKKNPTPRTVRIDTRLTMASGRVTALRTNKYEYVYYCDQNTEELYDLSVDPYETNNILTASLSTELNDLIFNFRYIKDDMEDEINCFHIEDLQGNFERGISKRLSQKERNREQRLLLVTQKAPDIILICFAESAKKVFPNSEIRLLIENRPDKSYEALGFEKSYILGECAVHKAPQNRAKNEKHDIIFYLTEESRQCFINDTIVNIVKELRPKHYYMLDYNFRIYRRFLTKWFWPIKNYIIRNSNAPFYKEEPMLIFKDVIFLIKMFTERLRRKPKKSLLDAEKAKKMRDRAMKANK